MKRLRVERMSDAEEREYCQMCGEIFAPSEHCSCTSERKSFHRQSLRSEVCEHENE